MRTATSFIAILLVSNAGYAQVPTDSLALWLRADQGVFGDLFCGTPAADDARAVCWKDQGPEGFLLRLDDSGNPSFAADSINGFPVVRFDSTGGFVLSDASDGLDVSRGALVFVVRSISASGTPYAISPVGAFANNTLYADDYIVARRYQSGDFAGRTQASRDHSLDFSLLSSSFVTHTGVFGVAGNAVENYVVGQASTADLVNPLRCSIGRCRDNAPFPAGSRSVYIGQHGAGNYFEGEIAEVVVYRAQDANVPLRVLVENYLASKYDLPLDPTVDRYAGDTEANGDYDFDVSGIGADADSIVAAGASSAGLRLAATNESLDAGEYVLAGHRETDPGSTTDDLPDGIATRLSRVWYIDKTGAVDVALSFGPSPGSDHVLLYRAGTSGTFSILDNQPNVAGGQISFSVTDADLQDGYYTLGGAGVAIANEAVEQRPAITLSPIFPNPFSHRAVLTLALNEAQSVTAVLLDATGRTVATLHDGVLPVSEHRLVVDGANLPSGIYFVRVTGETFRATRHAVILR